MHPRSNLPLRTFSDVKTFCICVMGFLRHTIFASCFSVSFTWSDVPWLHVQGNFVCLPHQCYAYHVLLVGSLFYLGHKIFCMQKCIYRIFISIEASVVSGHDKYAMTHTLNLFKSWVCIIYVQNTCEVGAPKYNETTILFILLWMHQ